ncbi:MAG: cell division protein FtsZ, partial [Bacteroidetes bacterium]|nr:cell division protein FtsZ [Bacteroidota bacterium]
MQFIEPEKQSSIIKVIGVGGGGGNAVNHMYRQGIEGVDFIICNTDNQALEASPVPLKYQLGAELTEGLGAGADPEKGKKAAIENLEDIEAVLADNTKMVFITAGMGGGTGTGAAPVIAQVAREMGILTVGIVTTPFRFEGRKRMGRAIEGIEKMQDAVDSLLVINNEKLRDMFGNLQISKAFEHADNILTTAAKSIAEIITYEGYINVDFQDVRTVMANSGVALMGTAIAEGEDRAMRAVKEALLSPLLADNDIKGAKHILLNISSGSKEITMDEISQITEYIIDEAGEEADMIWGNAFDEHLDDKISVTIIATAFESKGMASELIEPARKPEFEITTKDRVENLVEPEPAANPTPIDLKEEPVQEETVFKFELNPDADDEPLVQTELPVSREGAPVKKEMNLEELETVPAFVRKKKKLEKVTHSADTEISRFTLKENDDKKPEI